MNERWVRWPGRSALRRRFAVLLRVEAQPVRAVASSPCQRTRRPRCGPGHAVLSPRSNGECCGRGWVRFRAPRQEPVCAALRLAGSRGKRLVRPRTAVDAKQVAALRATGASWRIVSRELGIIRSAPRSENEQFAKNAVSTHVSHTRRFQQLLTVLLQQNITQHPVLNTLISTHAC